MKLHKETPPEVYRQWRAILFVKNGSDSEVCQAREAMSLITEPDFYDNGNYTRRSRNCWRGFS